MPSATDRIAVWPMPSSRSGWALQYSAIHVLYASKHACLKSKSGCVHSSMPTVG